MWWPSTMSRNRGIRLPLRSIIYCLHDATTAYWQTLSLVRTYVVANVPNLIFIPNPRKYIKPRVIYTSCTVCCIHNSYYKKLLFYYQLYSTRNLIRLLFYLNIGNPKDTSYQRYISYTSIKLCHLVRYVELVNLRIIHENYFKHCSNTVFNNNCFI